MAASPKIDLAFPALNGTLLLGRGNILTQYNARCKLECHCSFGFKFNVPVRGLSIALKLAEISCSQNFPRVGWLNQ